MKIPEEEFLAPGHRGCAGCGATVGVRLALKVLGKNTVAVSSTGCLEVITTPYPETAWRIPWIHVAFENAAAVASGVERALKAKGRDDVNVVAFAGDGGTADIGLQALSGAMERGHNIIYICYDNEAYMNTGIQRSASTPYGASTTTSPHGKESFGEDRPKKNMPLIMAAHGVPYVATASISYPEDFMEKVRKAKETDGPAYIHLHQPCTTGWGFDPAKTVELGRLAVETGSWILYEIEDGDFRVTYRPVQRKPVEEYLNAQKRFRHLTEEQKARIQEYVDSVCQELRI
ncbi:MULTISPECIES: pyruvate synthase subunit PorB [Methanothermobacter]|jgi:pyruvate ferredoxin oxidoreductase beta subunit|uniref:Pyruvate synthase subunit PorB n=2 Tax=Methanothermobacter thermautotrophicus TaxID=145262 RepID=PORB_METTH|nr:MULTISPECIES: pyruvate synthase subunit PorB [Methanothermobacter]O27771.1 RecName: Full=Pyruvate synthase subunit PorB; AltName: Full=Pyruvate oxidoreductase beta chain; Short=POR; AltName: Full=Pyruvic-ferredoxin oxidoreductase subunit beta [Methanothermobacter thermautotrophicus str. Delta H]MDK2874950.1 pyruvate ferredoxin oxidoreductase beta subunit [Methanothermobacter sp.]AAB86208.1 pyruvate oxidoreductase, beta subunit [Methanothermobacter thermautotrophicus str. Delta H]MDI6819208.1